MWKHFCIVPMRIHLLICIKLVGSRHWFRSIPVNLLLWDESIKVWLSDKLASSLGWTKAISNANKISCSVWWGCFWYGFDFKLGTSLTQNYPSIFAVYLKTSVHLLCQKKLRNHRSRPPPPRTLTQMLTYTPCPAATCVRERKAKQHSHKHFNWRGKFSSCVTQCPIDFQKITLIYSICSAGPKCSPVRKVFSFHGWIYTCIFLRNQISQTK